MTKTTASRILPGLLATALLSAVSLTQGSQTAHAAPLQASCNLNSVGGQIKRVMYLTFDNVHFRRDNPNVPSDLEQMPNLLNFILNNGTLTNNHWTPLISHTSVDILTALTGVYGDRHGVPVGNSYGFFNANGTVSFSSSFLYWTAIAGDGKPAMVNELGKIAPAPWVPYTRAGCDVGAYSVANIELESSPADVRTFFGTGSPEDVSVTAAAALPNTPANQAARTAPTTDYLGFAVHCAQNSPLCSDSHARNDLLPDEPGGYTGFKALFGNVNVAPVVCANVPAGTCSGSNIKDLDGNVITDAYGRPGFPNIFSPTATQSLGVAATMFEAGVPVIYIYVADAHDRNPLPLDPTTNAPTPNHAFGPGEAEFVAQLKKYDTAFGQFFARLAADGIDKTNTLFVIVPDENDHVVTGAPTPPNCDGVNIPCTYTVVGEVNAHLNRLLLTQRNNTTPFSVHSDDAPTVYINGNPGPTDPLTRNLEKDMNLLTAVNPISGNTDKLSQFLADKAEMGFLHMVTTSPARTPSFTMFGNPDYFFITASPNTNCSQPPSCVFVPATGGIFAYNHGDVQPDITRAWLGMVGPGVRSLGLDNSVFSDHTDVRPTMLSLLGLNDDYIHDGRVLVEKFNNPAVPLAVQNSPSFTSLADTYKQINAPLGSLGKSTLANATAAITSDDATYAAYLSAMGGITAERDALAGQMKTLLENAAFSNQPIDDALAASLISSAQSLTAEVGNLQQAATTIVAAVAPNARTTVVGTPVTAFATILNAGPQAAHACSISLPPSVPAVLIYQTTNPATNALTGSRGTPVDIAVGGSQSFVFSVTPLAAFSQEIQVVFSCANARPAPVVSGLNTLLVTVGNTAVPDMLSVAATSTNDGNLNIPSPTGTGFMVAAAINIGAAGTVTFTATDTAPGQVAHNLPLALSLCQTDSTGKCINPASPGASVTLNASANQTVFFTVFATGTGTPIPYDPANSRVLLLARQGSTVVGEASAAVKMTAGQVVGSN